MKKALIAGAASVVLAAMPVVGVFAADGDVTSQVDKLSINITPTCTMSTVSHANGSGTWGSEATANTLSATVTAGQEYTLGTTTFLIKCNNKTGWNVAASANALAGTTTTSETIPVGTTGADTAAWSYTSSTEDSNITADVTNNTPVANSNVTTGNDGRQFVMTYKVSTDKALSAQTYEGTITYTLAANA